MKSNQLPVLGFLGAGAIVSAMVRGFCERAQDTPYHLVVSDMRPEACEALRNQYPESFSRIQPTRMRESIGLGYNRCLAPGR